MKLDLRIWQVHSSNNRISRGGAGTQGKDVIKKPHVTAAFAREYGVDMKLHGRIKGLFSHGATEARGV